jgi:hypothetical protein
MNGKFPKETKAVKTPHDVCLQQKRQKCDLNTTNVEYPFPTHSQYRQGIRKSVTDTRGRERLFSIVFRVVD